MNLRPIKANMTELTLKNGTKVLYSYSTPVAATGTKLGTIRTSTFYSRTTSRHINEWLGGVDGGVVAREVSQAFFDKLLTKVGS